jgi:glycosyltransferase involved in cell wall biosynthesis
MVPAKDYRTVVRAARLLGQEDRTWRFVLVGDGEGRAQLMAEAAALVNEGSVEFPEPGLEVLSHVQGAQVGVLMTDPARAREGCSNAIMEYMACGLPVVCSEGGGNREVVVDGTTGFLIPPSDVRQLATKLVFLRDHETERRAMGEAGRRRIKDAFSLEMMVESYVRIYEDALSASGSK